MDRLSGIQKQNFSLILSFSLSLCLGLLLPSASGPQDTAPVVTLGQSATLLPDGRWLLIGGEGAEGPLASASVWDPDTNTTVQISDQLTYARAYHTATLLPDGTVFIWGGIGANGQVVSVAERFDPQTQQFAALSATGLTPRAYHTATLLTEGRVLMAGGLSGTGDTLATAELWNPRAQTTETVPDTLSIAHHSHTATLLSDGTVLLWGGVDANGNALNNGELYDPITQQFTVVDTPPSNPYSAFRTPQLAASIPEDGVTNVPVDTLIALRFSEPLRVETVNTNTVTLTGPDGVVATKVTPAEEGMLAFITPAASLLPGATYTLLLSGPTDRDGFSLEPVTIQFITATHEVLKDTVWIPTGDNSPGDWLIGLPDSPWQSLPPLEAEPGVTALAGQALKLNGDPLPRVTLQIAGVSARTDDTGRFLLEEVSSGHQVMLLDGRTANTPPKTYGIFEIGVDLIEGQTNVLPFTIWMPQLDMANAASIPSPTYSEVVVTTPTIPGLEVHIPPATIIRDIDGNVVTTLSITPIPLDRGPMPGPSGTELPLLFTLQPGGSIVETSDGTLSPGISLIFPNAFGASPGTRIDFWRPDPTVGWLVYGQGTVTENGQQIMPDPGVAIHVLTCASIGNPTTAPSTGKEEGDADDDGEPVDLSTGLFVMQKTDLFLPDILPITLTRTYRQNDTRSRPFGIGATHPFAWFLVGDKTAYTYAELILEHGGRIRYNRISSGTGYTDAVMEHTGTPSRFYKSVLSWNSSRGGWDIKLRDGTIYEFFVDSGSEVVVLQAVKDRNGNKLTITLDSSERVTKITSPNGRWIEFTYDTGNRITQAKDNIGRIVTYTYDASGRLIQVTDPNGGFTDYTYDTSHRVLTIKDAREIVFLTNEYDTNGRVIKQTQVDTTTYQFAYTLDGTGKVTQTDVTDPRGNVRRVTFSSTGYTLTDTRALGTPEQQTITYERQAGTNLVLSVTDALNRRTAYAYDSFGNVTSITRLSGTPDVVTTTFTYESTFNLVASITDPLNHATTFTYDTKGNLTAVTDPLNNSTTLAYNTAGQPISITDPLGNTTLFTYDSGDLVSVTDPLGNNTTRFIDSAGRLLSLTNPLGHLTRYDYDVLNRLTKVTDPLSGLTQFTYDPNGNLLTVKDANLSTTTYTYDNMDRLSTRRDPLLVTESYLYDNNGNLSRFTDRKSQATNFTYDALNRRTQATYADLSTTTYTYDAGNRLTQIVDSISGTITLTYDNLDRLTQETTPQGTVTYTYDGAGRRTSMTVAGQPTVNYTYNNANRLTQITQGTSTVTIAYDAAGRRTSLTLPNGIVVQYGYDAASRLTSIQYFNGATLLGDLIYTYDGAGNRIQVGGTYARTGLPQAVSSATYNAANQLINWGGTSLTYDTNGNLTNDGTNTYTWNARNQLASMTGASFAYDPLGRRVSRTVSGTTTSYLYDGVNPVQELSGTTPPANLLTGLGIDEYFTRTDAFGAETLLTDALGSTVALTDPTGVVLTEYTYEPFGRTTITGAATDNPFQYTGRENDGTGLYYYRARYYSSSIQRFISEDPILAPLTPLNLGLCRMTNRTIWLLPGRIGTPNAGISQFLNSYAYVQNNPLRLSDPMGLIPSDLPCAAEINACINATKTISHPQWGTVGDCIEFLVQQRIEQYCKKGKYTPDCMLANFAGTYSECFRYLNETQTSSQCKPENVNKCLKGG
jgi:RHS repeat-associated protein